MNEPLNHAQTEVAPHVLAQDKRSRRKRYGRMMAGGLIAMLLGIGGTALGYVFAIKLGSGGFLVFYGAIVSGLIAFIMGFISWFMNHF
jgi:hypothetical protein